MRDPRLNDGAEPAKASSPKRQHWIGQPPWIKERVAQEERVRAEAELMGVDPSLLLKPNTRKHARSLDPALTRFHDEINSRRDEPIPF